jgi:hypothetical protein
MKNFTIAACLIGLTALGFSQEMEQKEVKKEVIVEISDDGQKMMTIKTTTDGKTTAEVLRGDEADAYLEEMHHGGEHRGAHRVMIVSDDGNADNIEHVLDEAGIVIEEVDGGCYRKRDLQKISERR